MRRVAHLSTPPKRTPLNLRLAHPSVFDGSGFRRLAVQAALAQQRYKLGLSSKVELGQAQLNPTQAQISQASGKYDYTAEISALNFQARLLQ